MPEQIIKNSGGEAAYAVLRRNIVELRLKPGAVVSIKELCTNFGLNRTPARDALIRLSQEGLISLLPQRGVAIAKIDLTRVENERFLRASAEEKVMRAYLSKTRGPGDIPTLERLVARQRECLSKSEYRRNMALDDAFHRFFYDAVGLSGCADIIWHASGQYGRLRLLIDMDSDISEKVLEQHIEITKAIRNGDEETLASLLETHLSKIEAEGKALCAVYPELFVIEGGDKAPKPAFDDFLKTLGG